MGGASVPVFSLAGAPLAARLGRAPPPPRAAGGAEPIPGVPGAFFVADVLDAGTCAALAALGGASLRESRSCGPPVGHGPTCARPASPARLCLARPIWFLN